MIKKIDYGKTPFHSLHQVLRFNNHDELLNRKARLFPSGNTDSEVSTTSIFLASLCAVKEYREKLLTDINIKKIKNKNVELHAFTEINNISKEERPDGLLVITSGKNNPIIEWACFIEVKVGNNPLDTSQIDRYTDFARLIGINDLITISNDLVTSPFDSPIKTSKRKFNLFHWSWTYLKVAALRLIRTDGIEDEDHVFMLKELRRYFDHHKNMSNYTNMGKDWKEAVNKIHPYETKQKVESSTASVILNSYKQEEKDISLQLTDKTSFHVELINKGDRTEILLNQLQLKKVLTSDFIINKDKNCIFTVEVDFTRQAITCSTKVCIEKGKAIAQTSALIKDLENETGYTDNIHIQALYNRNKAVDSCTLAELIKKKELKDPYPIVAKELGDTVKIFSIKTVDKLGRNFQSTKNFIVVLEEVAYRFLTQVMENLGTVK